ncbi:unnamed protein product [Trichogramma brassicae]|uniref:Uncharacterized protein n=1 Tax=Trichogramma brassicae TaxID=86971 RepID=A0A6H5I8P2_9HYME|nr:unnamed protein product [Trichogramma brassicae]
MNYLSYKHSFSILAIDTDTAKESDIDDIDDTDDEDSIMDLNDVNYLSESDNDELKLVESTVEPVQESIEPTMKPVAKSPQEVLELVEPSPHISGNILNELRPVFSHQEDQSMDIDENLMYEYKNDYSSDDKLNSIDSDDEHVPFDERLSEQLELYDVKKVSFGSYESACIYLIGSYDECEKEDKAPKRKEIVRYSLSEVNKVISDTSQETIDEADLNSSAITEKKKDTVTAAKKRKRNRRSKKKNDKKDKKSATSALPPSNMQSLEQFSLRNSNYFDMQVQRHEPVHAFGGADNDYYVNYNPVLEDHHDLQIPALPSTPRSSRAPNANVIKRKPMEVWSTNITINGKVHIRFYINRGTNGNSSSYKKTFIEWDSHDAQTIAAESGWSHQTRSFIEKRVQKHTLLRSSQLQASEVTVGGRFECHHHEEGHRVTQVAHRVGSILQCHDHTQDRVLRLVIDFLQTVLPYQPPLKRL